MRIATLFAFSSALLALCACSTIATQGPPGPAGDQGPPGAPGPAGPPGPAGAGAVESGARLLAQHVAGEDGSRAPWAFRDTTYGFDCRFQVVDDGLECRPDDVPDSTGFNTFVAPDCSGDFGWTTYKGSRVVHFLPTGAFYAAQEEVPVVYTPTPSPNGPCAPYLGPGPFYRWALVEDFVSGEIE